MSFAKFFSLVSTSSLFFCRAAILAKSDPFEGCPNPNAPEMLRAGKVRLDIMNAHGDVHPADNQELKETCDRYSHIISEMSYQHRKSVGINSWHAADYESAALWSIYSKEEGGIAIKSNAERFRNCFRRAPEDVHIGLINYIDYNKDTFDFGNVFNQYFHKRKSFEHEKEIRAITVPPGGYQANTPFDVNSRGKYILVNLYDLIECVYISPFSDSWIEDIVRKTLDCFGIGVNIHKSDIETEPIY